MFRFPNPGSDLGVFTSIFGAIQRALGSHAFGLDDISATMVAEGLASSQGAVGDEALARSTRSDRSRDPLYNQSKMYAELWRQLGWISSVDSALQYGVTRLGAAVASASNPKPLVLESLLGIAAPSLALEAKNVRTLRPFYTILRTMDSLGGELRRDEMIVGPLALNDDRASSEVTAMLNSLRQARRQKDGIADLIEACSEAWKISHVTMGNYTRFPMAAIQWAGWALGERGKLTLTPAGRACLQACKNLADLRTADYTALPPTVRPALIRVGFHNMLARANEPVEQVRDVLAEDCKALRTAGISCELVWFSPYQQLPLDTVNAALSIKRLASPPPLKVTSTRARTHEVRSTATAVVPYRITNQRANTDAALDAVRAEVKAHMANARGNVQKAIDSFVTSHRGDNRDRFYPLVEAMFNLAGFDCRLSRAGVNYSRHDAILLFQATSVPIEIKSPGEEPEMSVKGVRQALENKIVLLARKAYPCDKAHTSLVVGFNRPNERSEVHEVIENIYAVYGVRIGVVDLRVLAQLVFDAVANDRTIEAGALLSAKGVIDLARQ
jgi:hypothetical protein